MKRAPSEDLFRLIKSLNKGEKRNFKMLAGLIASEKDKKYIGLFEVIDKQEVYNEVKVTRLLKDLYGGQLAVGKHYLHRLILKSLVHYRTNPAAELGNMLEQAKVLMEKELYDQAKKLLRKCLADAVALEDLNAHYGLLQIQLELLMEEIHDRSLAEKMREISVAKQAVLAKLHNLDAYRVLSQQMVLLMRRRKEARAPKDNADLDELLAHPLLQSPDLAMSTRARLECLTVHRKACSFRGDLQGAADRSRQLLALYDAHPLLKEECIRHYFAEVSNLCSCLYRIGESDAAFSKLEEFKLFRNEYPKARVDFFVLYYLVFIAAAIHVGAPERAILLVPEIEEETTVLNGKIPKSAAMWLHFLLAYAYLMVGKPKAARIWICKVLEEARSDVSIDLQGDARILNMLIQFELGNYSVVESEYQGTKRFLEKNGQLTELERITLRGMKALALHAEEPQFKDIKESWRQRYLNWQLEDGGKTQSMIDFGAWLESLVTRETMAAIVRARSSMQREHSH
jgi:hypothetical protein